jgi:hypothetical protein
LVVHVVHTVAEEQASQLVLQSPQGTVAETKNFPVAAQDPQVLSAAKAKLVEHVVQVVASVQASQFVEQDPHTYVALSKNSPPEVAHSAQAEPSAFKA